VDIDDQCLDVDISLIYCPFFAIIKKRERHIDAPK